MIFSHAMWSGWGHFEEIPSHIFGTEIPDSSGIGHSQKNANFTQYSARSAIYTSISCSQDRFWFQVKYVFLNSSLALRIDDAFLFVDPCVSVRASDIQLQVKRMKTRMLTGAFDRIAEMARDYTDGRQSRLHCSGRGDNAKNMKKKGLNIKFIGKRCRAWFHRNLSAARCFVLRIQNVWWQRKRIEFRGYCAFLSWRCRNCRWILN